ncbi:MAG: hypothetical protein ACTSP2_08360 [Alphaproteobacteria bacterium]
MIGAHAVHGHAIVTADDMIADASGRIPPTLQVEADWQRFQAALDAAVITVLGRKGHETHPNRRRRRRMIVSAQVTGLSKRTDGWWWNPADIQAGEALATAAPTPGIVAVPGGQRMFDLFLGLGFDEFHLTRVPDVSLPDGLPVFSAIGAGLSADEVLTRHGLTAGVPEVLDGEQNVTTTVWSLPAIQAVR